MAEQQQRDIGEIPIQRRFTPISTVNSETRTADVVWTTGAGVRRYDWNRDRYYIEELSTKAEHVRMARLQSGAAPLLDSHNAWQGLRSQIGVVESATLRGGEGLATVRFSKRDDVEPIFRDVVDKIIRNVSVGYVVHRYEMLPPPDGGDTWIYRAVDYEPMELSLVPIGADPMAGVRDAKPDPKAPTFQCEFITPAAAAGSSSTTRNQETTMTDKVNSPVPAADPNAGTQQQLEQVRAEAAKAERERVNEIHRRCTDFGLGSEFASKLVEGNVPMEAAYRAIVDEVAKQKQPAAAISPVHGGGVRVVEDERVKIRNAISSALVHRINPVGELPNNGASEFRYMSLTRLAEEVLRREGVDVRGMPANMIATRALHSNSDFANILADASNKRLRQAYEENMPSYTRWARRAPNAPDFKTINVTTLSGAPDLQKVLEGGEFKRGKALDGKETYQVFTYGRIIGISRQALVNDDLSAFDRLPRALGAAARRLENATVYGILTTNAAMADTGNLFNVTAVTTVGGHANLGTGTGSALGTGSMATARTAMRRQVGLNGEPLNVAPAYLIAPATLEQTAYQMTSNQYVPATKAETNEFRAGGRTAVEPIIESVLDGNSTTAWYFAADPQQIDTVEYCYLDGSEGLYLEPQVGFNVDGIELKARLDFAAAAIDFRGLYKGQGT